MATCCKSNSTFLIKGKSHSTYIAPQAATAAAVALYVTDYGGRAVYRL